MLSLLKLEFRIIGALFIMVSIISITSCKKPQNLIQDDTGTDSQTTNQSPSIVCNGVHPHAINLGLPSGTLWACCNLGAKEPQQTGDVYAWGEVVTKELYVKETYLYYERYLSGYTNGLMRLPIYKDKYQNIGSDISGTKYDAATVNWGSKWRMPTYDEFKELIFKCDITVGTYKGIKGNYFTGKNGNSIFIPCGEKCLSEYPTDRLYYYWTASVWGVANKEELEHLPGQVIGHSDYVIGESTALGVHSRPDEEFSVGSGQPRYMEAMIRPVMGGGSQGGDSGQSSGTETNEKPNLWLEDYSCNKTSIKVVFRIESEAKITSCSVKYGTTSSTTLNAGCSLSNKVITATVSGLKQNTKYYFCASATNANGTGYSDIVPLMTL